MQDVLPIFTLLLYKLMTGSYIFIIYNYYYNLGITPHSN